MRRSAFGVLVVLVAASFTIPVQAQKHIDPFGPAIVPLGLQRLAVPQQVPTIQERTNTDTLNRFSDAIIKNRDRDKLKDELFEAFIFELARNDRVEALAALAERGDKLGYRDTNDNTLMHVAAKSGSISAIEFLVKQGLDVDADNADSRTPLSLATEKNLILVVRQLLKSGASPNGNSQESHPLATAARYGRSEIATLLIEKGAKINQRDSSGDTALHHAVRHSHYQLVEALLFADADQKAKNDKGETPESLAGQRLAEAKVGKGVMRSWGTEQIHGPANARFGDDARAWASKSQGSKAEWLVFHYEKEVVPTNIEIYENLGQNSVNKITLFDEKGKEHELWSGKDPAKPGATGVYIAKIKFDTKLKSKKIKVYLGNPSVKTWYEIDAAKLTGKDGSNQWVKFAEASSCYAGNEFPWTVQKQICELIGAN